MFAMQNTLKTSLREHLASICCMIWEMLGHFISVQKLGFSADTFAEDKVDNKFLS